MRTSDPLIWAFFGLSRRELQWVGKAADVCLAMRCDASATHVVFIFEPSGISQGPPDILATHALAYENTPEPVASSRQDTVSHMHAPRRPGPLRLSQRHMDFGSMPKACFARHSTRFATGSYRSIWRSPSPTSRRRWARAGSGCRAGRPRSSTRGQPWRPTRAVGSCK